MGYGSLLTSSSPYSSETLSSYYASQWSLYLQRQRSWSYPHQRSSYQTLTTWEDHSKTRHTDSWEDQTPTTSAHKIRQQDNDSNFTRHQQVRDSWKDRTTTSTAIGTRHLDDNSHLTRHHEDEPHQRRHHEFESWKEHTATSSVLKREHHHSDSNPTKNGQGNSSEDRIDSIKSNVHQQGDDSRLGGPSKKFTSSYCIEELLKSDKKLSKNSHPKDIDDVLHSE